MPLLDSRRGRGRNCEAYETALRQRAKQIHGGRVLTMLWFSSPAHLRTLAVSLYKIGNDIRLMSCVRVRFRRVGKSPGERARIIDHAGKVNRPGEALTMIAVQVMATMWPWLRRAGGYLEMNVYSP